MKIAFDGHRGERLARGVGGGRGGQRAGGALGHDGIEQAQRLPRGQTGIFVLGVDVGVGRGGESRAHQPAGGDVVGMAGCAIRAERDDDVRAHVANDADQLLLDFVGVNVFELAVGQPDHAHVGDAEYRASGPELRLTRLSQVSARGQLWIGDIARLTAREAGHGDGHAFLRVPGECAAHCVRFVVRVGERREQTILGHASTRYLSCHVRMFGRLRASRAKRALWRRPEHWPGSMMVEVIVPRAHQ